MPDNRAAWQPAKKEPSLKVASAPYKSPPADGVVVKTRAVAVNPIDWLIQDKGDLMFTWLKYPFIFGLDVAGEVVEVGKNAQGRFKVGDRVVGFARGTEKDVNDPSEGGFQEYTVLRSHLVSHIPSGMTFESAAVIPLGLATAAAGLFEKDLLNLERPNNNDKKNHESKNKKVVIVWGGSTSVGCNAIQLAAASGYEVLTTASPKNFALLQKLGATQTFDYKSPSVVSDMVAALKGKQTAGALAVGPGSAEACMDVLGASRGHKFIAMASFPLPPNPPQSFVFLRTAIYFVSWMVSFRIKCLFKGVQAKFFVASVITHSGVGRDMFVYFLPKALETGTFVPAPEPLIVGHGLESLQAALDEQKKGVSARKIVVTL
jgi:NADPH:quinone reductase-like Zn-dependent oxidoreductase